MKELKISSYRGRSLDPTKPVKIYRCLNRTGKTFSVMQDGLVVGHVQNISLRDVKFKVNRSGKARCLETGQRNVHAFVEGVITDKSVSPSGVRARVSYSPFSEKGFILSGTTMEVNSAKLLTIKNGKLWV